MEFSRDSQPRCPRSQDTAILGVLGRGRAGIVYEARELARDRRVALELIEAGQDGAPGDQALVQFDAGATRLHHPNIVPLLSTGRHDGAEYLAAEFVEGETLSQYIGGRPRPILTAAAVVAGTHRPRAVNEGAPAGLPPRGPPPPRPDPARTVESAAVRRPRSGPSLRGERPRADPQDHGIRHRGFPGSGERSGLIGRGGRPRAGVDPV